MTRRSRVFTFFLLGLWAMAAAADDPWHWLASAGFTSSDYELLQTWKETGGPLDGDLVTGYALRTARGKRVEVYRLGDTRLSAEEAAALGIQAKDWDAPAVSVAARPGSAEDKSAGEGLRRTPHSRPPDQVLPPLPAKSRAETARHEAADAAKGVWRAGDYRALPEAIHFDAFTPDPADSGDSGDYLYSIRAAGALGIRLHLETLRLPEGAALYVYAGNDGFGPYVNAGADGLWTPTLFGDQIDIVVTGVTKAQRTTVALNIPALIHQYRGFDAIEKGFAGACNLDVTCYPGWAGTALGAGVMGTAGPGGSLFCTGTLIADASDCIDAPLFLTANHCVGTQTKASSLEFYWEFQSAVCDGLPPDASSVPRTTGGAVLLATQQGTGFGGGGNDFSLLRLNNAPPGNITRVGWTTNFPALGTEVTCVHHPRTEYKRISFGTLTDTNNVFDQFFHEVTWDEGTTEPGSSGSPLMLTATQQIIGQLWGGGASCIQPLSPDYYGRFDVTHAIAAAHLDPTPLAAFTQAAYVTGEDSATVTLNIVLSAPAEAGGVDLVYSFAGGSATANVDYDATPGVVNIPAGLAAGSFDVAIFQDTTADDGEKVEIALSIQSGCAKPSATLAVTTLTINDDDADTDGDGISDEDETNGTYGAVTDPNLADSDGDGLSDYEELFATFGYLTGPNLSDTDGDGYADYTEILLGTDPTVFTATGLGSLGIPSFRDAGSMPRR